jgi:hypothetical protein
MYSWSDDTSDWYGKGSYGYGETGKTERDIAARLASAAGPRTYERRSGPLQSMIDPHKQVETASKNPLIVAVDVTGSMAHWPFEIFDRLPLFYNTLAQYREDVEVCFAAIGDAGVDRWPLQVTGFAKGYDLEQQLGSLYGEGGGGDAPESYGLFAWWVEHHVKVPNAKAPFLIVFGDAPMHAEVPKKQIQRVMGDATPWTTPDALATWRKVGETWNTWFLRRPTGRKGDEVDEQWQKAVGADKIFRIDDEARAVDYAMGLVARAWGRFADFQKNMLARQDETKVKAISEKIRAEGPRVMACPSCAARLPAEASGRFTCTFCGSTLEL